VPFFLRDHHPAANPWRIQAWIILGMIFEEILMKKKRYSDAQFMGCFRQAESGVAVAELCREHGFDQFRKLPSRRSCDIIPQGS
jgi:Transposase